MNLWIASSNKGKILEFKNLLADLPLSVRSVSELDDYYSPEETGDTFEKNAEIKAKSLAAVIDKEWIVADDSGLACEGLNGMPGIHSARYAGENARDSENVAKLLKMLQMRTTNRKAKFVCSLVVYSPSGDRMHLEGELLGEIARKQSGKNGFGYDPVFVPEGYDKTLAEMESADKNKISHRANAIKALKEKLKENL